MKDIILQAYFESLQKLIKEQSTALKIRDDLIQLQEKQIIDLQAEIDSLQTTLVVPPPKPKRRTSSTNRNS